MRYPYYLLIFLSGILTQWFWSMYGSIWGLAPQILLILTMALSWREQPHLAMTFAFLWGLLSDAMRVHLFGADALILTCIAYMMGLMRRQMDVSSLVPQVVLLAGISYAYYLAIAVVGLIFEKRFFWAGWKIFLLVPLYNCLVAPFVFSFVQRFTRAHDI